MNNQSQNSQREPINKASGTDYPDLARLGCLPLPGLMLVLVVFLGLQLLF